MRSRTNLLRRVLGAAPITFLWTVAALAQQTPDAAAPAAAAPASAINSGDTAWMMTVPGLALF